ncbi:MAG: hypothetical protein NUV77_14410, partial [Thermoguttaceae bacterium]|nr:hypothetical protein [Thermoguttaceae bacterium]
KHNRFEERQIGLVTMARDRYVAREAGTGGGKLRTPLVVLAGSALTINAKVDGALKVRLVDSDDRPIPGFDGVSLHGDRLDHPVPFAKKLTALANRPVRLEFELQNAQVFGFDLL